LGTPACKGWGKQRKPHSKSPCRRPSPHGRPLKATVHPPLAPPDLHKQLFVPGPMSVHRDEAGSETGAGRRGVFTGRAIVGWQGRNARSRDLSRKLGSLCTSAKATAMPACTRRALREVGAYPFDSRLSRLTSDLLCPPPPPPSPPAAHWREALQVQQALR
jgi:hypothetical protein